MLCLANVIDSGGDTVTSDRRQAGVLSCTEDPPDDTVLPSENMLDGESGLVSSAGGPLDSLASMPVVANGSMDSGPGSLQRRGRRPLVSTGFGPPAECRDDVSIDHAAAVKRVVSADPDKILARSAHLRSPTDDFGAVGGATTGSQALNERSRV